MSIDPQTGNDPHMSSYLLMSDDPDMTGTSV
jgi:hypothetical protein